LLSGYRTELANFASYKTELQEFYAAEEDIQDDAFGSEFDESGGNATTVEITRLTNILEMIKMRVDWLETLKGDAATRDKLGSTTGIDLTIESLDRIIDATRQQILFIEGQIQKILQGTQASTDKSIFMAESGNPLDSVQAVLGSHKYSYNLVSPVGYSWY
jgi:hypothetical protein